MSHAVIEWKPLFAEGLLKRSLDLVRQAVAAGMPINGFDEATGEAPIHQAVGIAYSDDGIVEALLAAGADPNLGERGTVQQPLKTGRTPLMLAANFENLKIVKRLLQAGADATIKTPAGHSVLTYTRKEPILWLMLQKGAPVDSQSLWSITATGNSRMVQAIIDRGVDVNAVGPGGTAIHATITYAKLDNLKTLLRAGADPKIRLPAGGEEGHGWGLTPLEFAKQQGAKKFVKVLQDAEKGIIPPAPVPRGVTPEDLPELWKELEKVLKKERPEVRQSLAKGAPEKSLAALEAKLGFTLPAELRASLKIHNGQTDTDDSLFPAGFLEMDSEMYLLNTERIVDEWSSLQKLVADGEFVGDPTEPDPGVRDDWWQAGWIPFAEDGGGNSLCVDTVPTKDGTLGQVILLDHERLQRRCLAKSLSELLVRLIESTTD